MNMSIDDIFAALDKAVADWEVAADALLVTLADEVGADCSKEVVDHV